MKILFSTKGEPQKDKFRKWKEFAFDRVSATELDYTGDQPFEGLLEISDVGPLNLTRITCGKIFSKYVPEKLRCSSNSDSLIVSIQLCGSSSLLQDGKISVRQPGEFVIIDRRANEITTDNVAQPLLIEIPRDLIEKPLGSTRRYTAVTIGRNLASTALTVNFFKDLADVSERLSADVAARMVAIGIDLIVASIAERLAQDAPRSLHGTIIVQRAKAYVEAHFGDTSLDSAQLAAALGVSLRRLQQLFHEHGHSIADWIWHRRLEVATQRLADPGYAHLSIGEIAYGSGFLNQAHFTRRFKELHGITPRDYQWRSLIAPRQVQARVSTRTRG